MKLSWIVAAALVAGCSAQARQPNLENAFECDVALSVEADVAERHKLHALNEQLAPFVGWYAEEAATRAAGRTEAQTLALTERFTRDAPYRKTIVNGCVHRAVKTPGFDDAWVRLKQAAEPRPAIRTASL
jgi:hypothetical protein